MFSAPSAVKDKSADLVHQANQARIQRQLEKHKANSALIIQTHYRGYRLRRAHHALLHTQLNDLLTAATSSLKANDLHQMTRLYLFLQAFSPGKDLRERDLARLCTHLALSVQQGELGMSYVSLILSKRLYASFVWQSKRLVGLCVREMRLLRVKEEAVRLEIVMNLIVVLVSVERWRCFAGGGGNRLVETLLGETVKAYLAVMQAEGKLLN